MSTDTREEFDIIVIGGGPAGYSASIRAAQMGFKVACIEKCKTLGGTCLNVGCIPSKALLDSSEHYQFVKTKLQKHGVLVDNVRLDLAQMMKRKDAVVRQLTNGILGLFRKYKVQLINGTGKLSGVDGLQKLVDVMPEGGQQTSPRLLTASRVLIATGSQPVELPFLPFDGKRIVSSTEALSLPEVPKHLVVIGGGVIGLELGSVWMRLGAKVTVVEFRDRILPEMDSQVSGELQKSLIKQGMEFHLATKCLGAKSTGEQLTLEVEEVATGNRFMIECDTVLVAVGRKPFTEGLGLEDIGIRTGSGGRIEVQKDFQTSASGIFAVGDVIPGPMLAHKAEEDALAAIEYMAGQIGHVNYNLVPGVVYTWPEFASIGATEDHLKSKGIEYKTGVFPFMANGRAKAMDEIEGFVKVLADAETDNILGIHILGPRASDLIAEAASFMNYNGTAEDIGRACHAHPTLAEALKEAALAVDGHTINI